MTSSKKRSSSTPGKYSVSQYASMKGLTQQAVRWQCANSKLPVGISADKIGSTWIITVSE